MGSDVPEFCLKWNNHHSVLVSVLDALLERERLVDVTLAAEGQFLNVHRLVLFACSQYFEDLLSQQPDKPAVVFLKDVRFNDLKALVEYMYKGEVNVSQDQLTAFLETAEALKIKGLVDRSQQQKIKASHSEPQVPQQQPEQQKQKALRVNIASQQNATPVQKMSIPVICPDSVKSIQQTPPSLPTKSITMEQPKEIQESVLPLEQEMVEGDENFISFAPKQEGEMAELILEDDQFEATEHWTQQDAEDDGWSNSRDEMSGTRSGADNSLANPSEAEWEHNSDDPANPTAGPSRPKRKATSMSATTSSSTRGKFRGMKSKGGPGSKRTSGLETHPHSCSCGRKYTLKCNLYRHRKFECGKEPSFCCPFPGCASTFHLKHNLRQHFLGIHKEHPRELDRIFFLNI